MWVRHLAAATCLLCASAIGACDRSLAPHEPGPDYVHQLPRCEDQARSVHKAAKDCAFAFGAAGFGPGDWLAVHFSPPNGGSADGRLTIGFYSDQSEPNVIHETGLKAYDYPFMMDVTGEGGEDIFIPVQRGDGRWVLSVWLSNFLDDYNHHTGAYLHAGQIPFGRVLELDGGRFVETASDFNGPWDLTLYRAGPSGIEPLGNLVAKGDSTACHLDGKAASLLQQLPPNQIQSICGWFSAPRDYYDAYGRSDSGR